MASFRGEHFLRTEFFVLHMALSPISVFLAQAPTGSLLMGNAVSMPHCRMSASPSTATPHCRNADQRCRRFKNSLEIKYPLRGNSANLLTHFMNKSIETSGQDGDVGRYTLPS